VIWYVRRRANNTIASAHAEPQPGYAEEALDDSAAELVAFLSPPDPITAPAGYFLRALIELGWYDAIAAVVAGLPDTQQGKIAKVLWARAVEFPLKDPLIAQIAQMAGMTVADVKAVYRRANSY
jgi:hypothetical protein